MTKQVRVCVVGSLMCDMVLRLPRTPPLDLDTLLTIEPQPNRIWE